MDFRPKTYLLPHVAGGVSQQYRRAKCDSAKARKAWKLISPSGKKPWSAIPLMPASDRRQSALLTVVTFNARERSCRSVDQRPYDRLASASQRDCKEGWVFPGDSQCGRVTTVARCSRPPGRKPVYQTQSYRTSQLPPCNPQISSSLAYFTATGQAS